MEELAFDELTSMVLDCTDLIPPGKVATYGDIAKIVGTGPRQVGRIMAQAGQFTCWWRVVRADGSLKVAQTARAKWEEENIKFSKLSVLKVDMKNHRVTERELEQIAQEFRQVSTNP
ncbi:methylated-DNA--protein-cysteine methyltransferase [Corynebacterium suranareeae]|uniref:Methylated-DNA--protein-cysteine methyltransferase n=1 Tax=Corynebacterium suranareeae TaxID=2506452 RepID=A0A160PMJ6_9CORY|nr:MGMT family protein [Corynebacterium suranareeae]BAU94516.1 methylated-DNA--protein-cysteine methyltransferase [Corynebacterium suranareeae]